jgi:hypothetical protein
MSEPTPVAQTLTVDPQAFAKVKRLERGLYIASAVTIAGASQVESWWVVHGAAFAVLLVAGLVLFVRAKDEDHHRTLLAAQRAIAPVSGSLLYIACLLAQGWHWWEGVGPVVWAALLWWLVPVAHSLPTAVAVAAHPDAIADSTGAVAAVPVQHQVLPEPASYEERIARFWAVTAAGERGIAKGTALTAIQVIGGGPDFEGVVVALPGQPVPNLQVRALAALFDCPVERVTWEGIDGSGPGRMRLVVAPTLPVATVKPAAGGFDEMWRVHVAAPGKAAPGLRLVSRRTEGNRMSIHAQAPQGTTVTIDHGALCSAFGVSDPTCVVVETDGVRDALISVYRRNPLLDVRKATREDLVMDSRGRIRIGVQHDGSPALFPLYDPDKGALRGIDAGCTGAGKSVLLNHVIAGEKINRIVSWVIDLQGGASLPEARGRVDWMVGDEAGTIRMLKAVRRVMKAREKINLALGRGSFFLNDPYPLLNITCDEINRLLSHPNAEIKKLAAQLIADVQKTGRKVGVGIRLGVQSLHLADLGDENAIREQGKDGPCVMMRVMSSSTKGMGLDGIAPLGFLLENIPERIYPAGQIAQKFAGTADTDGESTAGMGYLFANGRATLMRVWKVDRYPGLNEDLVALYGPEAPATLDEASAEAAGADYLNRPADGWMAPADSAGPVIAAKAPAADGPEDGDQDRDEEREDEDDPAVLAVQAEAAETLTARILAVVAEHGPIKLAEIRKLIEGYTPGTINNAAGQMWEAGDLVRTGHGVYDVPNRPVPV